MADEILGKRSWLRPPTAYERFCEDQGVPIYRGMLGVRDVRDLGLGLWPRMGGRGAFIDLDGMGGLIGSYLVEVPGGGALEPERHLYEEVVYVLEGRGSTEIWVDDPANRQLLEWRSNSLFTAPLNTWHRIVNATADPALLLVATNAPSVFELYRNTGFIFGSPFHFSDRYDAAADYFEAWTTLGTDELTGRALNAGAVVPDIVNCEIPHSGQRGAGHRHFYVRLGGNVFRGHIAEYPAGRYSKFHAHEAGPVLVCLAGEGFTLTWPKSAGTRPWETGQEHLVRRQDYKPGGIVSAAPGGSEWFHGHFASSTEPVRVMAWLGGYPRRVDVPLGGEVVSRNEDLRRGGNTIEYRDEDPAIREIFKEELSRTGAPFNMPAELYE
jgi:quercetin dioxygenase-like cupin family protein